MLFSSVSPTSIQNIKTVNRAFYTITADEEQVTIKALKTQCPALWNSISTIIGSKDNAYLRVMAIGHKSKRCYLQHLVDDYQRSRIEHMLNDPNGSPKGLLIDAWASKLPHFKVLKKLKKRDEVIGAVRSFQARVCQHLSFSNSYVIDDSIQVITQYLEAAVSMITTIFDVSNSKIGKACCPLYVHIHSLHIHTSVHEHNINLTVNSISALPSNHQRE